MVEYLTIDSSIDVWVKTIKEYKNSYERKNTYDIITAKGYNIKTVAKELEDFYLDIAS
jgi:hypothetical protein